MLSAADGAAANGMGGRTLAVIQPRPRARRTGPAIAVLCALAAIALLAGARRIISLRTPSTERVEPPAADRPAIVTAGTRYPVPAAVVDGELLLPVRALRDLVDPGIEWDAAAGMVIATTGDRVVRMRAGDLTAFVNGRPVALSIAPLILDGMPYVPAEPFARLLGLSPSLGREPGVVVMDPPGSHFAAGETMLDTAAREAPSIKARVVADLARGSEVYVFAEKDGWYLVRHGASLPGYVPKAAVVFKGVVPAKGAAAPARDYYRAWKRTGERINLAWEHVLGRNPAPSSIGPLPGVNVLSPTWLRVTDGSGSVTCRADPAYVRWAHSRGCEVWALVDNGFDPDRTRQFLSEAAARENIVRALLVYAEMYDLDGINIDFENVYHDDAGRLVQFVRELTPLAHEQGLTVSVDVTVKSSSRNWSLCYDRKALANAADYLVLMAYDEHPAGSATPGPTASLPWVENGIRSLLEEVAPSRVVLGVPLYTRLWKQPAAGARNSTSVTQCAVSMEEAARIVRERGVKPQWDAAAGQFALRYEENGHSCVMWIEDEQSLRRRVALVKKYGLAGIAAWRRGFEIPAAWTALAEVNLF